MQLCEMYSFVSGFSGTDSSRVKLVVCSSLGHVCARVQDVSKPSLCDVSCSWGSFVSRQLLDVNDVGVRVCVCAQIQFLLGGCLGSGVAGSQDVFTFISCNSSLPQRAHPFSFLPVLGVQVPLGPYAHLCCSFFPSCSLLVGMC